ncbi:MAG: hypothetical protein J5996_07170 [Prevotella sp.]|nr:hypothetical protein [Prevotella sp.]
MSRVTFFCVECHPLSCCPYSLPEREVFTGYGNGHRSRAGKAGTGRPPYRILSGVSPPWSYSFRQ